MNTDLMLLGGNVFTVGLLLVLGSLLWKFARWTSSVDASLQLQAQNIEQLRNAVQNLTNNFSRLDTSVTVLSEKVDGLQHIVHGHS